MNYIASFLGEESPAFSYFFVTGIILIVLPMLAANFTALLVVAIITTPLLIDFVRLLSALPIEGDRHGYAGLIHVLLLLPTPSTLVTRIAGLIMERRGWSRRKAIIFDVAGLLLYISMIYLYREYGSINPMLDSEPLLQ
jgi:hypothetical protein